MRQKTTIEDTCEFSQTFPLSDIDTRLTELAKAFTAPLFELFEFHRFEDTVYSKIVTNFFKKVATDRP